MSEFLSVGDVIEINKTHKVYAMVPEHFVYGNRKGSFKLVESDVYPDGELDYLQGKYVVISTKMTGGSYGSDPYPDGHLVECEGLESKRKISFYQSGCFTAMIQDIKPIGKAKLAYVLE